jgi:hypothetical protein
MSKVSPRDRNILLRNPSTGVVFPFDEEMAAHPEYRNWPRVMSFNDVDTFVPKVEDPKEVVKSTGNQNVIMKTDGTPFASESAARSARSIKKLDENEWMVLEVPDGFILTKV